MQNGNFVLQSLAYNHQVRILFVENTELLNDMCHPRQCTNYSKQHGDKP